MKNQPNEPTEFEHVGDDLPLCWCCGRKTGDDSNPHASEVGFPVCALCWDAIPPHNRLWLQLFSKSSDEGGIGLRELFEASLKDLDLVKAFGYRPGSVN